MKERTTQALLVVVGVLLGAILMRLGPAPAISATKAGEAGKAGKAPAVLRAQAFELVNKQGKVVAQLHLGEDGGGNLRLRSGNGTVRVKLGATADGSGLLLCDKWSDPAVSLVSKESGTSVTLAQRGKKELVLRPGTQASR